MATDTERRGGVVTALVGGLASALVAASGLRPVTRRWPAALLGSVPSFLATEVPGLGASGALVVAVLAWRRGAVTRPAGRVGLGVIALAVAVLTVLDRRARHAGAVLEDALRDGLGPLPAVDRSGRTARTWGARRRYSTGSRDLVYGPHGAGNLLDVWRDPDLPADARAPVLLQVHGGAWSAGRKEGQAHPLMAHLVARGWVCVTVDYRLGPTDRWPAMIVDVKRAIAWTRAHIAEHGGDPGFLAVTGGSAGAHLAALAALTPGEWQPGFDDADTSVDAAVCLYGIYDLTGDDGSGTLAELLDETMMPVPLAADARPYARASPSWRVHAEAPPVFVLHGTGDAIVSPRQSERFAARLRAVSRSAVVHAELPNAQHGFDLVPTARTLATVRAVETFLVACRAGSAGPSRLRR